MSKVLAPNRLAGVKRMKVTDFPREGNRTDFGARAAVVKCFNYCRQHPAAMDHFKNVLVTTLNRIQQWEQLRAEVETQMVAEGRRLEGTDFVMPQICHTHGPAQPVQEQVQSGLPPRPVEQVQPVLAPQVVQQMQETLVAPNPVVAPVQTPNAPQAGVVLPPLGANPLQV